MFKSNYKCALLFTCEVHTMAFNFLINISFNFLNYHLKFFSYKLNMNHTHWRINMAKLNQKKIDKLFEQIDESIEKIQEKQAELKSIIEDYIYEIDSDEEDTDSDDSYADDENEEDNESMDEDDSDEYNEDDSDEEIDQDFEDEDIKPAKKKKK